MGFLDKLSQFGKAVGTNFGRKVQKELGGYKSLERAQKELDKQQNVPKRAPLNVPKKEFSKEKLQEIQFVVDQLQQKNEQLLKHMNQLKIVSRDPAGAPRVTEEQHSHDIPEETKGKLPQQRHARSLSSEPLEVPRGLAKLSDLVNILHNHRLDPVRWTPGAMAEKFNLRERDVENLIEHFRLLTSGDTETDSKLLGKKGDS